jgi:hypothetical protein
MNKSSLQENTCKNTPIHPQTSHPSLTLASATVTPKHLVSSLLPLSYRLPLANLCIGIMFNLQFNYKQLVIVGTIITQNSHVLFSGRRVELLHGLRA